MEGSQSNKQRRRVIILRHGERVDFTFGTNWIQHSFEESKYIRKDLNMPEELPTREFIKEWEKDTPLTTMGCHQAHLVGSSLKNSGVKFAAVFVSPSYRCLLTATTVLKAMGLESELPLNVDYGLFEWVEFYNGVLPKFLSENERAKIFNVNNNYKSTVSQDELLRIEKESLGAFYDRSFKATRKILSEVEGDVLIVAHGTNHDTCTRQLTGRGPIPPDVKSLWFTVPYLGAVAMEQTGDNSYQIVEPPCLTLTHKSCWSFDWRHFIEKKAPL